VCVCETCERDQKVFVFKTVNRAVCGVSLSRVHFVF